MESAITVLRRVFFVMLSVLEKLGRENITQYLFLQPLLLEYCLLLHSVVLNTLEWKNHNGSQSHNEYASTTTVGWKSRRY